MRTMGNKGAVGVRMVLHCTSFCILAAHLASGQDNVLKRNDDINTILQSMDFNAVKRANAESSDSTNDSLNYVTMQSYLTTKTTTTTTSSVMNNGFGELLPRDHDIILVAGDLNYRLDMSYEEAVKLAAERDVKQLMQRDQLKREMGNPLTP
uniref:Synaptojanin-2 n=1 Tax=Lygus hesperus TaxID=30085 RepID=A0A0A9W450_LYGHE